MPEYRDEGREAPSGGGDNQPDEISDETPDAPDETPDEGLFNPNDDAPNETPDEELFNPNDETPDEELFNPNDETPDEELFNPNDETPDEELFNPNDETPDEELFNPNDETPDKELFNPNDDVPDETPDEELFNPNDETPDEELFNPNDETPDEELFNPNDDIPDETPDEELFNPNDDIPDEPPDENYNPGSSGTITVTVPEEPKQGPDNIPETNPEQDHENEPETEPESDPEEDPEKEIELINSEGDPMPPVESKEVMELRRDLEEAGLEPEYEPELDSEHEDQNPEIEPEYEPENEPESESKVESQQTPENEPENEPETQPEEIELMTPKGEPISHPEQVPTELIPLEDAIQKLYEQQQNPEGEPENEHGEIPEQESEIIPEQESETIPEQESDLIPEQKPDKIQKKKRIKAKNLKLITDQKELGEYKHYERQHIVKTKYDVIFGEKQLKKSKKKAKTKKKKPEKVKDLKLITDPKELENYTNYGERKTSKTQVEKSEGKPEQPSKPAQKKKSKRVKNLELIIDPKELEYTNYGERKTSKTQVEKSEGKPEKSSKQVQNTKPKEIKNLELITEPIKTEKVEEKNESKLEKSSESQNINKKELDKVEIASSESQKQSQSSEHSSKQSKSETVSKNRIDLREKYRQETGKRPIYNKKETKGFLSWLEKQKKLVLKKKQEEKVGESKEEWEILLEKWILEASESKVSAETKKELIDIIRKYSMFREIYLKLIELLEKRNLTKKEDEDIEKMFQKLEQVNRIQADIFRNLRAFQSLYNQHNIWNMNRILREREKFINFLTQNLKSLKKTQISYLNRRNLMEILKENLYKSTMSLNKKSKIIKIFQKTSFSKEDEKELMSLLSDQPTEDLVKLFGKELKDLKYFVFKGFNNLMNIKLRDIINIYYEETGLNANSGLKFTNKFRNYIKSLKNISDLEKREIRDLIDEVECRGEIEEYIVFLLKSTSFSIDRIIFTVKQIKGLTTSYKTIKELERKHNLEARKTRRYSQVHPDLIENFFEKIDTIEKAYFLGLIYADGWLIKTKDETLTMGINIKRKDEFLVINFILAIKANMAKKKYYIDKRNYHFIHIDISNQKFCEDLKNKGVKLKKSLIITLPKLKNRKLYLAFLLGYYDGDGIVGTTRIVSGSRKFLEQIKALFNLKFKIGKDERKKHCYHLHLGASIFNEMMNIYKLSLPRKRRKFYTEEERVERAKNACKGKSLSGKLSNVSKQELEELVWKIPLEAIGKIYNCSGRAISKKCEKLGIEKPPLGYWKKKNI